MPFEALALICALGQDPQECIPQTARTVEIIGEEASELGCARASMLALGGHVEHPKDGEYAEVICIRKD
jgi:hypothetical protein